MNDKGHMLLESIFYMAVFSIIAALCMDVHINCAIFQSNIDSKMEIIQQGIMIEEYMKKNIERGYEIKVLEGDLYIEDGSGNGKIIRFDKARMKLFHAKNEYYTGYEFGDYVEDIEIQVLGNNIVDVKIDFKKGKLKHKIDFRVKNRNVKRNIHISGF